VTVSIADPKALVRFNTQRVVDFPQFKPRDQVDPLVVVDQIDFPEFQLVSAWGEVVDREDTLFAIVALTPESKQVRFQLQSELCGVGMKRRLARSDIDSP
jgi:hypothetical protein